MTAAADDALMDANLDTSDRLTDYREQFLRVYVEPPDSAGRETRARESRPGQRARRRATTAEAETARAIRDIAAPYGEWCFVFDCETTADERQELRFLVYEVHGVDRDERLSLYRAGVLDRDVLDRLHDVGIAYNPSVVSAHEVMTIRAWAEANGYDCMTVAEFVPRVFYRWVYRYQALCIGHNLAFDLSRLVARSPGGSLGVARARDDFAGGFTLQLCSCRWERGCFRHPFVRIKHLGEHKNRFEFRIESVPRQDGTVRQTAYRGKFLDTATFGRALLGPGDTRLLGLVKRFTLPGEDAHQFTERKDGVEHGLMIDHDYLDYGARDVIMTWQVYQAERELYRRHGLSTPMWQIYSEASIAKAYDRELGVPPFRTQHPGFPAERIGHAMVAYYGGRTEVNTRLSPVEILYLDCLSQYATVNALMGLQELLLAERIEVEDCTASVRTWLARPDLLEQLAEPDTWRRHLRTYVKVQPEADILPLRSTFGGAQAACNIALCELTGPATWYALADVVASVLLTGGRLPAVCEAFTLTPHGQVATKPWNLFGDERYRIDLGAGACPGQDFFTRLVEMRREVQANVEQAASDDERAHLDGLQRALKILASAGSYGVLVEVNPDEPSAIGTPVTLHGLSSWRKRVEAVERPGAYFAGPIGALIPAGGRLLVAIAERLGVDRGLRNAFCDTDSIAFARPDGMSRAEFSRRVSEIIAWFGRLSPYEGQPPLWKLEKENAYQGQPEPLIFLGISPKRYVLYNRCDDGRYRIAKVSAHGTGTWEPPGGYISPDDIPDPVDRKGAPCDPYELGGPRWLYDLWYRAIEQVERGEIAVYLGDDIPGLDTPALHRVTVSTWNLYEQCKDIPDLRPFTFITVLPPLGTSHDIARLRGAWSAEVDEGDFETAWFEQEEARNDARREWTELRKAILDEGGIRRTVDVVDTPIPPGVIRRAGLPADVMASQFGYDDQYEFVDWVWSVYQRYEHRGRSGPRVEDDNPYAGLTSSTTFHAPYGRAFADIVGRIQRSDTHELVEVRHATMRGCLADYFGHPNAKASEPRGVGWMARRRVRVTGHIFIGKETNRILEELEVESEGALPYPDAVEYGRTLYPGGLREHMHATGKTVRALAGELGCSERQLKRVLGGAQPKEALAAAIAEFLAPEQWRRRHSTAGR